MVVMPFVVGMIGGGIRWVHLPLAALWISGYCTLFAGDQWLHIRSVARKRRAALPLIVWALATLICGVVTLIVTGVSLLWWIPVFAPLLVLVVVLELTHQEHGLLARSSMVCAAGLMCAVSWNAGSSGTSFGQIWTGFDSRPVPIVVTALVTGYLVSTVPYVKSLVREAHNPVYRFLTVSIHGFGIAVACVLAALGLASWWIAGMWVVLTLRQEVFHALFSRLYTPARQRSGEGRSGARPSRARMMMYVGITEVICTCLHVPAVLIV